MSKKWLNATFSSFYGFCLSLTLPGGKTRKVRKPDVSIRSDVHAVRAGIKLKGQPLLNNPGFIDRLRAVHTALYLYQNKPFFGSMISVMIYT